METSEVLYRAADLIEQRGWATGGTSNDPWGSDGGPVCLEGAIYAAEEYKNGYAMHAAQAYQACPAYRAMHEYLGLRIYADSFDPDRRCPQPVYQWNDAAGRTKDDVVAALRAAAVIEAAKENQNTKQEVAA